MHVKVVDDLSGGDANGEGPPDRLSRDDSDEHVRQLVVDFCKEAQDLLLEDGCCVGIHFVVGLDDDAASLFHLAIHGLVRCTHARGWS